MLTGSQPYVTRETINLSRTDIIYDNTKVKEDLDFEFRNLEETVSWACNELENAIASKN